MSDEEFVPLGDGSETSVGHQPGIKWEFDATVTDCFDDMLTRSIPQYDVMRDAVFAFVRTFHSTSHPCPDPL